MTLFSTSEVWMQLTNANIYSNDNLCLLSTNVTRMKAQPYYTYFSNIALELEKSN
jgi:hypothetical protein